MDTYLRLDVGIPVVVSGAPYNGAAAFVLDVAEDGMVTALASLSPEAINAALNEAKGQGMPVGGSLALSMGVEVINDMRGTETIAVKGVFVGDSAQPELVTVELPRRATARLTFSDVKAAAAQAGQYVHAVTWTPATGE